MSTFQRSQSNISVMTDLRVLRPYPLRIQPKPGESLKSMMHRLSERNGLSYFNWIVRDMGVTSTRSSLNSAHIARLSKISGLPLDDLMSEQAGRHSLLPVHATLGHKLTIYMVERSVSRICIECLRQDPYHRSAWDFVPLMVCPTHATPIIGACPICNAALYWSRNRLTQCGNGHDLLDSAMAMSMVRFPPTDLAGMRAVSARLLGSHIDRDLLDRLPLHDDELPLVDLVRMFEVLGSMSTEKTTGPRMGIRSWFSQKDYHLIVNRGYRIASNWPHAFHHALEKLGNRDDPLLFLADTTDPRRKRLHKVLGHWSERPFAQLIGREIWQYATQNHISLLAGAFGVYPVTPKGSLISSTEACRVMKTEKVAEIARGERWLGYRQVGKGHPVMLLRSDVERWIEQNKIKPISIKALRGILHVTPETIIEMRDRGLFGEVARLRRTENGGWHALPSEVEAFCKQLRDVPRRVRASSSAEYISWVSFKKRPEASGLVFADAISGVIAGRVRAALADTTQLSRIRFRLDDLCAFASSRGSEHSIEEPETDLAPHSIVRRYGITWYCLQRAINLGILPARIAPHGVTSLWIRPSAMDDFLTKFTTPGILGQKHKKFPFAVARALAQMKVQPYLAGKGKYPEAKIYTWEAIERVGLKAVLKLAADLRPGTRRNKYG